MLQDVRIGMHLCARYLKWPTIAIVVILCGRRGHLSEAFQTAVNRSLDARTIQNKTKQSKANENYLLLPICFWSRKQCSAGGVVVAVEFEYELIFRFHLFYVCY